MPECWPQVCRIKITFGLLLNNWFVSTKTNSMKCFVNWIPLNAHVRFNKTQPYLKMFVTTTKLFVFSPRTFKPMTKRSHSRFKFTREQFWYKLLPCKLVNPTIKISHHKRAITWDTRILQSLVCFPPLAGRHTSKRMKNL